MMKRTSGCWKAVFDAVVKSEYRVPIPMIRSAPPAWRLAPSVPVTPMAPSDCGWSNETVGHLLEDCPLYKDARKAFLGRATMTDAMKLLNEHETLIKAARFMFELNKLEQFKDVFYQQHDDQEQSAESDEE